MVARIKFRSEGTLKNSWISGKLSKRMLFAQLVYIFPLCDVRWWCLEKDPDPSADVPFTLPARYVGPSQGHTKLYMRLHTRKESIVSRGEQLHFSLLQKLFSLLSFHQISSSFFGKGNEESAFLCLSFLSPRIFELASVRHDYFQKRRPLVRISGGNNMDD